MTPGAAVLLSLALAVGGGRVLHVQAGSVVPDADGSRDRPFRTVGLALGAARDGDRVVLATGLYQERLLIERALTLEGPRSAVLVSPDATGTVVAVRAPARLAGLSVQGGEVGVRAERPVELEGVWFSAQRRAAVQVQGTQAVVRGGTWSALFDRPELVGLEGVEADLLVERTRFEGPFARAVLVRGGGALLDDVTMEGAVNGLRCVEGCRARVQRSVVAQGRGAGLSVEGGRLAVHDSLVSRWERCLEARDGAELSVGESATAFCDLAGISVRRSRLVLRGHVHAGQATAAAVGVIESEAEITEGVFFNPGATGLAFHQARGEVTGTLVRGARSEEEGDAVHAERAQGLVLRGLFLEASARTAITVRGGRVRAVGVEVRSCVEAGFLAEQGGALELEAPAVQRSLGPALLARDEGTLHSRFGRFTDLRREAAWGDCGTRPSIVLERTFAPLPVPEATCVEVR